MTEPVTWVPLGDTGMQVNAERLNDPRIAELVALVLDYQADCKRSGELMEADRIAEILEARRTP